jgi:hypothetical protein
LRMSLSENRFPPRIKSGAGIFRDMRQGAMKCLRDERCCAAV